MHLRAEIALLKRKPESLVKASFDLAIAASRRGGFSNFVAVINERTAYYFLDISDIFWTSAYMSMAVEAYRDWGFRRKHTSLIQKHSNLLPSAMRSSNFRIYS
jgi:RimJ/RimL family protein N-acetyltransferase